MKTHFATTIAFALTTGAALAAQPSSPQFAKHTNNDTMLEVPSQHARMGTVYHTLTDRDQQVYFESDAPLEDIKGQSNDVIGYGVVSNGSRPRLVAGEWHLPVKSMRTGIELRDEHLAGPDWLDAENHPHIVIRVASTKDTELAKRSDGFSTYKTTLVGTLSMHGVTREIAIQDTTITYLDESPSTRKVADGDLMSLRSKLSVTLADYGVSHPVIGEKVAKEVDIDVSLYLSTVPPSEQ